MITKTISRKMGLHDGMRAYLKNVPETVWDNLNLPELHIASGLEGPFDYMHIFVKKKDDLDILLKTLKPHLDLSGMLWVSWPKGGKTGTDLSLTEVIRIAYDHGLVESISMSINEIWSALKLTYPKKGKVYKNKYSTLPETAPRR